MQYPRNKRKKIVFGEDKQALWKKAQVYLQNPIKKKLYFDEKVASNLMYKSGEQALEYYTDLTGNGTPCFAISQVDYNFLLKNKEINLLNNFEGLYCLEVWKYPPALLANNGFVDTLSLYIIFKDNKDERIQTEIEKMMSKLW